MPAGPALTAALAKQVRLLADDLRERVDAQPDVDQRWRAEHAAAARRKRTGATWTAWRDDRIDQAAVAWVLLTVFVRFCEDNTLVSPVWIAGPVERRREATDAQAAYFRAKPEHTDREWLEQAVAHFASLPATAALVDEHSALHLVSPSGKAAEKLIAFWRQRDTDGNLTHDLTDPALSTRFLGDLYQDLSEHAKSTYALLQTPVFVEEFILDRTLEPALADRPLEGFRMIDPTCGSGHFLLGSFARLLDRWHRHAPGLELQARVQEALDAIHGVDLNPFAIAIARFRLTLAALQACRLRSLEQAPAFRFHLAVGDSLLHGPGQATLDEALLEQEGGLSSFSYSTEDLTQLQTILAGGRYDAVVGNPPYITVKDAELNAAYRRRYATCKGTYALTVPFMERFFGLAKPGRDDQPAGWVGQITSNSFMKREFGSKLIEEFLAHKDLRLVADTSGAYIPGHGTPTVILVGRLQRPAAPTIRAVLGVRGEPCRPTDAAKGIVWSSIVDHVDEPGWDDGWITVTDVERAVLATHPWSLGGGSSAELSRVLAEGARDLTDLVESIGYTGQTNADGVFLYGRGQLARHRVQADLCRPFLVGEEVRDYLAEPTEQAIFPYSRGELVDLSVDAGLYQLMWPFRTSLWDRATFTKGTYKTDGRPWWEWHQVARSRLSGPVLTWSFVQTHNHFAYLRACFLHNRSAPVIQLRAGASEAEHLELICVLNSSVACFWLKQNCHQKGSQSGTGGFMHDAWEEFSEFNGTAMQHFPLPKELPGDRGAAIDALARDLAAQSPAAVAAAGVPSRDALDAARVEQDRIRAAMIAHQEDLDWECYARYGLLPEDADLTYRYHDLPGLALGERAFEIALARQVTASEKETVWFTRHGSEPITDLPSHWPAAYRDLVQRRLDLIAADRLIGLLERPEYKRRWAQEPWDKREKVALLRWLLDRLEDRRYWFDPQGRPRPRSVAQLADEIARDPDIVSVLGLWAGRPDAPVTTTLVELLADEAVPYLAALRYKETGLRKRAEWETTWSLQRREDAGETLCEPISVPPKYTTADFVKTSYWSHRGKLDVPKERFITYPDAGRNTDPTPLLGWAGWDHAQQSLALALIIQKRDADGAAEDKLIPLIAGMAELQPWLDQWHNEIDPTYGVSPAAFCREQLSTRAHQIGQTFEQLAAWRPAAAARGRSRKA